MVWNATLKRDIPEGWHCGSLLEIAAYTNGLACQKFRPKVGGRSLPVIKIREMREGFTADTEEVSFSIPDSVKIFNGDVLFSWSASLEVILWAYGNGGLNQHIFKVTSKNDFPRSFYYFELLDYVGVFKKMAEARKTTMGHITQDHLQQSTIAVPDDVDITHSFEEKLSPIFNQQVKLQEEIQQLTKLRDALLPLLMNGQVSVNYDLVYQTPLFLSKSTANLLTTSRDHQHFVSQLGERRPSRLPDDKERLRHIFRHQVYGLAPTECIYRIALRYILGFDDKIHILDHNLRRGDCVPAAKAGRMSDFLDEVFGKTAAQGIRSHKA